MQSMSTTVLDELRRIYNRDGVLKAQSVVESARPESSPLHSKFEWDDTVAAENYRLTQAKELIRKAHVEVITTKGKIENVRAFVNLTSPMEDNGVSVGYFALDDVLADDNARNLLAMQMRKDFQTFRKRYEVISDLVRAELERHLDESA